MLHVSWVLSPVVFFVFFLFIEIIIYLHLNGPILNVQFDKFW